MSKRAAVLALAFTALAGCGEGEPAATTPSQRPTPSGLPVPRWVSLKFDEVNARKGPGDDHRLVWVYRVKGLPLQVIAETRDWRRVCDGEGSVSWVHKRVTTGERNVLNLTVAPAPLQAKPRADSATTAYLAPGALAKLDRCEGEWCRVQAGKVKAWTPPGQLWGTAETALCRAKPRT